MCEAGTLPLRLPSASTAASRVPGQLPPAWGDGPLGDGMPAKE